MEELSNGYIDSGILFGPGKILTTGIEIRLKRSNKLTMLVVIVSPSRVVMTLQIRNSYRLQKFMQQEQLSNVKN
jgi:hypothetical protein